MLQSQTLKQMRSLGLRGIALTAGCRSEAESPALFTAGKPPNIPATCKALAGFHRGKT